MKGWAKDLIIEIDSTYPGIKTEDLAIADLKLDGSGGHSLTERFCMTKK